MTLLVGALTIGLILSLLALGVYISFRIFNFPDITADGSITLGAAVAAVLAVHGVNPWLAIAAVFLAGMLAGATTGLLHARFRIHGLLSGILVMTALYSVNLHVMGRSNVSLLDNNHTVFSLFSWAKAQPRLDLFGWELEPWDAWQLAASLLAVVVVSLAVYFFFRTELGTAMRATGDNADMSRSLGINVGDMIILGLAVSNGLIALSGALLAQYQGFADVQMGIGMVVWGLASVIIGEALVGRGGLGLTIAGAVMGSVLFRLLLAIALRWGLNPNDLKLVTAAFVFAALVLPTVLAKLKKRMPVRHAQNL